jgi:membrane-bound lytic murein transglycosylase D
LTRKGQRVYEKQKMRPLSGISLLAFCFAIVTPRLGVAGEPEETTGSPVSEFLPENADLSALEASLETSAGASSEKGHRRGGRPKTPQARLPHDVSLPQDNAKARRSIASGATKEEIENGPADPALMALSDAESVLFPEPVRGLQSSWSFELPERAARPGRTLGLPLTSELDAGPGYSQEDIAWLKSLTMPDLPIRLDRRVVTYLKFYRDSQRGRTIAAIWTKKSGRYIAEMKSQFRRAGLPSDLVWLSMIESGHNPSIVSPAGAAGLWQFMPESARMYGLVVDRWVDERRDPARSTQAAVKFLGDLYRRFGNWELALGAYNMGYAGMSRAVVKFNSNDFWALSRLEGGLPWETTLYVPKIFALAIVMNNRDAFGVGKTQLETPEAFDTILVGPATPLAEVARGSGVSVSQLNQLNPQYVSGRLPPQDKGPLARFAVRVPQGRGERTLLALEKQGKRKGLQTYRVKLGDTIPSVAQHYGIAGSALVRENALSDSEVLRPNTVLLLPASAKPLSVSSERAEIVVTRDLLPGPEQRRVFYRVSGGETLEEIAQASGLPTADLARWNVLDQTAHLREGMILQLMVPKVQALHDLRVVEEKDARVLLAGSPEFHEYFESEKGKQRVVVTVRDGDTLARIGSRYGMTVGSMERVNRRSRHSKLVEGEQVIVYTEKKVSAASQNGERQSLPELAAPHPELLP